MPSRRPSPEHQAALERRLALLDQELAGARPARAQPPAAPVAPDPPAWWDDHTRPREGHGAPPPHAAPSPPPAPPGPPAPVVPVPGRHAARRRTARPAAAVAELTRLPAPAAVSAVPSRFAPTHLAVVAVVAVLGLGLTCWWLVRGDASPAPELQAAPVAGLVTPVADGAGSAASEGESTGEAGVVEATSAGAEAAPATVTVDVAGKVRRPGIAVLDQGARVVDALEAAGGAKPGVDLTGLNLARVLVDGEQVVVGQPPATGVAASAVSSPGGPVASGAPGAPGALVDLNTADAGTLDTLPDVGPVTAAAILAWRDQHGGYSSVDELLEVDGIGEATLAKIAPFVTV